MIDPHESTTDRSDVHVSQNGDALPPPIRRIALDRQPTVALPPSQDSVALANGDRSLAAAARPTRGSNSKVASRSREKPWPSTEPGISTVP